MEFVNLHHHSTFSYGDGFGTPKQHVDRAKELGYNAIALTEHGNVSSHIQLEKAALGVGLKPIFGVEAYCGGIGEERTQYKHHLTILAGGIVGYRSLNRIVTQSYRDHHYHPTVSGVSLAANSRGIVVLSGCSGSNLACTLLGGKGTPEHIDDPDVRAAIRLVHKFQRHFGDAYYLEVQPFCELPRTISMNTAYEDISQRCGVPIVVTHDVHYPRMEDAEMQAVLHAVHRGKASVDDAMREWNYDVPLTLPESDEELITRLVKNGLTRRAAEGAIETSADIAEQCNVTLQKAERLRYHIREEDLRPWV